MEKQNLNNKITVKDILKQTNGELIAGNINEICEEFSIDSRKVVTNDIYVGLKGENSNGGIYFESAFENGAKGCIIEDIEITEEQKEKYKNKIIIKVSDTIKAIQQIAKYKRSLYNIPVIAITGSVGKTSTKDIIANVVTQKFKTLKTQGNYNNHIGLPLTILKLRDHEALVVEMGMNHFEEISLLTKIAKPTIAVITNIGTAHIGILGSRENILKAKLEILEGLSEDGKIIINNDNDLLHKWYKENNEKYNIITYGIENQSNYMADNIKSEEDKSIYNLKTEKSEIKTQIVVPVGGNHFVANSLCAIAVGEIFNIKMADIIKGIESFELTKRRMDISKMTNNITIINDCYNANYDSMKAAIEYLGNIKDKRKIAVLGDMLELGDFSEDLHKKVGIEVAKNNIDILITVGKEAENIAKKANNNGMKSENIISCKDNIEAIKNLKNIMKKEDCILFKASNGMHFEEIIDNIQ